MPNIKLRDGSGVEQVYEGVDTISVPLADGSGTFTYGMTDEQLNLSDELSHYYTFAKGSPLYREDYFKDNYIIKRANMSNVGTKGNNKSIELNGLFYGNEYVTDLSDITIFGGGTGSSYYLIISSMFGNCNNLKKLPNIHLTSVWGNQSGGIFTNCYNLQNGEIEKFLENVNFLSGFQNGPFSNCDSVTSLDMSSMGTVSPLVFSGTYWSYYRLIGELPNLRELKLPGNTNVGTDEITSSNYGLSDHIVGYPRMLSSLTFSTNEDGTPYKVKWKNQSHRLTCGQNNSYYVGYTTSDKIGVTKGTCPPDPTHNVFYNITSSNITLDKIKEEYDRVKGFDDWHSAYSGRITYNEKSVYAARLVSRFNHDSIVGFINTLPDTSEYLATSGGTNIIQLDQFQGDLTDGGGVSDLTEEEIAVAAAKGWTISIV